MVRILSERLELKSKDIHPKFLEIGKGPFYVPSIGFQAHLRKIRVQACLGHTLHNQRPLWLSLYRKKRSRCLDMTVSLQAKKMAYESSEDRIYRLRL